MITKQYPDDMVSDCCGADPKHYNGPGGTADSDSSDHGVCPDCGDGCEYIKRKDFEDQMASDNKPDPETKYYAGHTAYLERSSDYGEGQ